MRPPNFELYRSISRVLAHEATDDDILRVERWTAQSPDNAQEFDYLRTVTQNTRKLPLDAHWSATHQWNTLHNTLFQDNQSPAYSRASREAKHASRRHWWVVGSAAAALCVAALGLFTRDHKVGSTTASLPQQSYATTTGQRIRVNLGDGTEVVLSPNSKIELTQFNTKARTVALEGEAYFEVTSSSFAPFTVQTGAVNTRVLGTKFTVRHRAYDPSVRVAVLAGKVAVANTRSPVQSITLAAGDIGTVTDSTTSASHVNDMTQYTGWLTNNRLNFRSAPTTQVLRDLEQWYGYTFTFADSTMGAQPITISLSTQSLEDALATLKAVLDVEPRINGKVITLVPRQRSVRVAPSRHENNNRTLPFNRVGR